MTTEQTETTIDLETIDNASEEELHAMLEQASGQEDTPDTQPQASPTEPQEEAEAEPEAEISIEDRLKAIEEQNATLNKRLKDKDTFIEQRNAEIGNLRKQVREREISEIEDTEVDVGSDEFFDNPSAAIDKVIEARKRKEAILETEKQENVAKFKEQTTKLINSIDEAFDKRIPDILGILKADEASPEILKAFEENPHTAFNPAVTLQLIKRATLEKEVAELRASLAEAQSKPNKMLDNLSKFGKNKSKVTNSSPSAKKPKKALEGLTEKDIDNMSYEELQALEKSLIK